MKHASAAARAIDGSDPSPVPEGKGKGKQHGGTGITSRPWWPWAMRTLKFLFFGLIAYLLVTQAREIEWGEVFETMKRRPIDGLLIAAAFAAGSFALYSCFDLLGKNYTGHKLPPGRVVTVNFISYAFNLNMGSLVGGVAFRYRLYSRLGLDTPVITRILAMSMTTNWLGYLLLGGAVFLFTPLSLPPEWKIDEIGLHTLGAGMMAVALAYVLACGLSKKREFSLRGHSFTLPSLRFALLQLTMSSLNWALMGFAVYFLLEQRIAYPSVLAVLLVGAIAGVITHVPAGLGVLEVVFVALLSHQAPRSEILAALLSYRAIYYLAPLIIATVVYLTVEARAKKMRVVSDSTSRAKKKNDR